MANEDEDMNLALETLSIGSSHDSEEQDSAEDHQPTGSRSRAKTCLLQSCECDGLHPQFLCQKEGSTSGKKEGSMNKEVLKPVERIDDLPVSESFHLIFCKGRILMY